jgi:uncharacterized DUF497 family protein
MDVIWDPDKAKSNFKKHGVHFSDAEGVLYDPYALTIEDKDIEDEHHYVSVGIDYPGRILVVVYTYVNDKIRLISARKAEKHERRDYEKGI